MRSCFALRKSLCTVCGWVMFGGRCGLCTTSSLWRLNWMNLSSMSNYLWILLALALQIIVVILSRKLHVPEFVAMPLAIAVWMLALFPFMKRWMPKTTFAQWAIAALIVTISNGVISFFIARLGWE